MSELTEKDLPGLDCGACGSQCRPINGTPSCLAGVCHIACLPGFGD